MRLKDKKIAFLIGPGFEDLEFWVVYMRLVEEGAEVTTVGLQAGETYTSKHGGLTATADTSGEEVVATEYDAVVVPGGWAPDRLRRDPNLQRLVKTQYDNGHIVGMICHAGLVGISAGIVKGHEATGSAGIKDDLVNAGANWIDAPTVRDANLVWGRVVKDIPDFCRELVKAIAGD